MKAIILVAILSTILCHSIHTEIEMKARALNHELIDIVNQSKTTWVAGHNKRFQGMTRDDVSSMLGAIIVSDETFRAEVPVQLTENSETLPENFDLREAYPQCPSLKEVRDQSTCGSCWAFGAVESMSDRICIQSQGKDQRRVSAEDLLSCCKTCGMGCNGGYPFAAFQYWHSTGLVTGDVYGDTEFCLPYSFPPCDHHTTGQYQPCGASKPTPKCSKTCQSSYSKSYSDDKIFGDKPYSVAANEEAIKNEIFKNGSVEVAFTVYDDFLAYKSGVYQHVSGQALGGHAVKMIGWGVENGTPYWLIVNSWNEDWGDKGTFKIKRGNNECGIEGQVVAGNPKASTLKFLK